MIDGRLYGMAPSGYIHQKLVSQLTRIIGNYIFRFIEIACKEQEGIWEFISIPERMDWQERSFCKKPALIVELKYGRSASTAIQQIKDRQYVQALEGYSGEILLVGVNDDKRKKDKPHSCVIEKLEIY